MHPKPTNKEYEKHFVEVFKSIFEGFPQGEIIADQYQERPDVIVANSHDKIGIEITRIHTEKLKREESEVEAAITEAQHIYEELNLPHLHVSVIVGDGKTFNRQNRKKFAVAIANLVSRNLPGPDGSVELDNDWNNPDVFPFEINSIGIYRFAKLIRNHWSRPDGGFFRTDFINELQDIISAKDKLLPNYDRDCKAHWLLIVAENGSPSSFFDPSAATLNHLYKSLFNRVFFMDLFLRKYSELRLDTV